VRILPAWRALAMAIVDVVQQFARLGEAVQVLGLPHEMEDALGAVPLVTRGGSVTFRNVLFRYPNERPVLENFSLEVPAGQKIGLVGGSGAGKTTLLSLLQRLYDPAGGQGLVDRHNNGRGAPDT